MARDRFDKNNRYGGYTDSKGNHYDKNNRYAGYTDHKGNHYDKNNRYAGYTDHKGNHYDKNNRYAGYTDHKGNHYDKNNRYSGYSRNNDSGCYLTTACVNYKGLEDNCKELTMLRNFRDSYMKENMPGEIDKYYEVAPSIVEKINLLDSTARTEHYDYIYSVVSNSCELIEANNLNAAYTEYKNMVEKLSKI